MDKRTQSYMQIMHCFLFTLVPCASGANWRALWHLTDVVWQIRCCLNMKRHVITWKKLAFDIFTLYALYYNCCHVFERGDFLSLILCITPFIYLNMIASSREDILGSFIMISSKIWHANNIIIIIFYWGNLGNIITL